MPYIDKLINHKKLSMDDMKELVKEQVKLQSLEQYIDDVEFSKVFMGIACYADRDKKIYIREKLNKIFRGSMCIESNILSLMTCNSADLYNMNVINTLFHEMWHARQKMQLDLNSQSSYSKLIDTSIKLMRMSGTTYRGYHNQYFHESDAVINSGLMTLNFLKDFSIQEKALIEYNRYLAKEIITCYALEQYISFNFNKMQTEYDKEMLEFGSPMQTMDYLIGHLLDSGLDINQNKESYLALETYIKENKSEDNITNLMYSNDLPVNTLKMINDIRNGKIKTTNLFETIALTESNEKRK